MRRPDSLIMEKDRSSGSAPDVKRRAKTRKRCRMDVWSDCLVAWRGLYRHVCTSTILAQSVFSLHHSFVAIVLAAFLHFSLFTSFDEPALQAELRIQKINGNLYQSDTSLPVNLYYLLRIRSCLKSVVEGGSEYLTSTSRE